MLACGLLSRVLAVPRLASIADYTLHPKHRKSQQHRAWRGHRGPLKINTDTGPQQQQQQKRHQCRSVKMMGVLKVVLPLLGTVQIVLAFLYADPAFQSMVRIPRCCIIRCGEDTVSWYSLSG